MAPREHNPIGGRTRTYGMGQWQASPDVPDVPGLKPGPLGPDTCRRAQPRAAPVVMWGGQVSKHVSGMRVHTSWLLVDDRRSCAWRTRELLTWPWDCTLRARVRQAGSGTRRAQGTAGAIPVRLTGRRCASRLHRTAHTSGSNQTIQPGCAKGVYKKRGCGGSVQTLRLCISAEYLNWIRCLKRK